MLADRRVRPATLEAGSGWLRLSAPELFAAAGRRWEDLLAVRWAAADGDRAVSWAQLAVRARRTGDTDGGQPLPDVVEAATRALAGLWVPEDGWTAGVAVLARRLAAEAGTGPGDLMVAHRAHGITLAAAALCGATVWLSGGDVDARQAVVRLRPRAVVAGPPLWAELAARLRVALTSLDAAERGRVEHALALGASAASPAGPLPADLARRYAQVAGHLAALRGAAGLDRCAVGGCVGRLSDTDEALLRAAGLRWEHLGSGADPARDILPAAVAQRAEPG